MRRVQRLACLVMVILAALLSACGKKSNGRMTVSVSVFPVYDLVRRVAGPDADVSLVVPPGRSEHGFEPTASDLAALSGAKLGVMVGLGLDAWMQKALEERAPNARLLKLGDRVPTLESNGTDDPHVWLDPERARLMVRAVAEELGKADSAHAIAYRQRATKLDEELAALDKELETRTKALSRRDVVTLHGAFRYFADRYGLVILGVVEEVPGTPPSPEATARLRTLVREKKVDVLYVEPQLDAAPANALAADAKIGLATLDPLGGTPTTDTYEKLLRANVAALERAAK